MKFIKKYETPNEKWYRESLENCESALEAWKKEADYYLEKSIRLENELNRIKMQSTEMKIGW